MWIKSQHFLLLFPLTFPLVLSSCAQPQVSGALGRIEGRVVGMDGKPLGNIRLTLDTIMVEFVNSSNYIQVDESGSFTVDIPTFRGFRPIPGDTVECRIMYYGHIGDSIRHASTPVITLQPGKTRQGVVLDLRKNTLTAQISIVDAAGNPIGNARTSLIVIYRGGGHGFSDAHSPPGAADYIETDAEGQAPLLHLNSDFYYRFLVWGDDVSYQRTELFRATSDMEHLLIHLE